MYKRLLKLLGLNKPRQPKLQQYHVSCSLREQVFQKMSDYDRLIDAQYKHIDMFCKRPIVEWDEFSTDERDAMEYRIIQYIDELSNRKRLIYELIMPLSENCN